MKFNISLKSIEDVKSFCDYANEVNEDIYLKQGRYVIDAKSVMGVFSLNLLKELELSIDEPKDDFYSFFEKIKDMGIIVMDWGGNMKDYHIYTAGGMGKFGKNEFNKARAKYLEKYGPVYSCQETSTFKWNDDPFPWEK